MFAVGLILWSSMSELDSDLGKNVVLILWWQFVGMLLLEVARLVNDKLLLSACTRATHAAHHRRRLTCWRAQGTFGTRGYVKPGSTTMWSWYDVCSAHSRQVNCALTPDGACCCDQVNHANLAVGFAEAGSYIASGTCLVTSLGEQLGVKSRLLLPANAGCQAWSSWARCPAHLECGGKTA